MSKEDIFNFTEDTVENERRLEILKKGMANAKKKNGRPSYQFSKRYKMIQAIKNKKS